MKFNKETQCYDEVFFNDLSDKAQNFLLKNALKNTEKQYNLSIKILKELHEIIKGIKNASEKLFIEKIQVEFFTNKEEIIFYENVPNSIQEIIKGINKLNTYTYHQQAPMINNKDFDNYISFMEDKLTHLKSIKEQIEPSLIKVNHCNILKILNEAKNIDIDEK